jgi:hypothetical protein
MKKIVRPPRLVDGPPAGFYQFERDRLPRSSRKITHADLAAFLVEVVERSDLARQVLGVCGGRPHDDAHARTGPTP